MSEDVFAILKKRREKEAAEQFQVTLNQYAKKLHDSIHEKKKIRNTQNKARKRKANPERVRAVEKAWRDKNPDKIREYNQRNYSKHKEQRSEYYKEYYEAHKEEINRKRREQRDPAKVKQDNAENYRKNKEKRIADAKKWWNNLKETDIDKFRSLMAAKARRNRQRMKENPEKYRAYLDRRNQRQRENIAKLKEDPEAYKAYREKKNKQAEKTRERKRQKLSVKMAG